MELAMLAALIIKVILAGIAGLVAGFSTLTPIIVAIWRPQ
jgi:hypothetical protein